jgi:hypothetical protein
LKRFAAFARHLRDLLNQLVVTFKHPSHQSLRG